MSPQPHPAGVAGITVVRQGDGYVLGNRSSGQFVAVPDLGGQVVRWLQAGVDVQDCSRRAADLAGEPVDVPGFLDGLKRAGVLPAADAGPATEPASGGVAAWQRGLGRLLFGPVGLTVQGLLALVAVVALIVAPRTRPVYGDAVVTNVPLASILLLALVSTALGLLHEVAHVLAAWAAEVPSRVSISRRMVAVVFQTDLTRLWGVSRRLRVVPLLAGMVFDSAVTGLLILAELTLPVGPGSLTAQLIRQIVLLNIGALGFQFLIFMRTDVYALFVLATGCKNLWATKGAEARRLLRRAGGADLALLATVGRREVRWARTFLCLYLPGAAWAAWYGVVFAAPATVKIVSRCLATMTADGLLSPAGLAASVAMMVSVGSAGYVVWGLARTAVRLTGQLFNTRTAEPS